MLRTITAMALVLFALSGAVGAQSSLQIRDLAFSPDGSQLAAATSEGRDIWGTATGQLVQQLTGHTGVVESVAWSADGSMLASASRDTTLRIWDAQSGSPITVLLDHTR